MFIRPHLSNQATDFSLKPIIASSLFLHPPAAAGAATTPFLVQSFSTKTTPPPPEKKSLSVATGELFLGIAARILKKSGTIVGDGEDGVKSVVEMFTRAEKEREWWWRRRAAVEDPAEPEVVWEQREGDAAAEGGDKSWV